MYIYLLPSLRALLYTKLHSIARTGTRPCEPYVSDTTHVKSSRPDYINIRAQRNDNHQEHSARVLNMCNPFAIFFRKKKNDSNIQSQPNRPVQPQMVQRAAVAPRSNRPQQLQVAQQPPVARHTPPLYTFERAGVSVQTTPVTSCDALPQAYRPPSWSPPRHPRNPSPGTQQARIENRIIPMHDAYAKCQVLVGPYSKHYQHECRHCCYPHRYGPCPWIRTALIDPRSRSARR